MFAGRVITAAYVPLPNYHQLFPDALRQTQLLIGGQKNLAALAGLMPPPGPGMPPAPPMFGVQRQQQPGGAGGRRQ